MTDITPTQEDRNAAAAWFDRAEADGLIRRGNRKDIPLVNAFARHRQAAIASVIAHATSDEAVERALQAECDIPGCQWDDLYTEGVARIKRMKMEKSLTAALTERKS
jgi:hypothetical protein